MSKAQFEIYVRKVMDLAHSLVLKSSATAYSINYHLQNSGYAVSDGDPTTWKYYQNLAGRYHSTDQMMYVTSLDTLQTIEFTSENLREHRTTRREYAVGGPYYRELVAKYPDQEMLIRGILNPVDLNRAIAAQDGDVLYYDASLVESNETNLIEKLQEWTRGHMHRWNVSAYVVTDDLYAPAQWAVMFMQIPMVLINIRLGNCHTPYAHSFHIREFLASNGRLDSYVDYLTKKQMLWLYRNIRYIHRNAGKQATFRYLMQNILTDRGLPLAEWTMRHNLGDQLEEIYPDIEFVRNPLNFGYNSAGADTRDVAKLLELERPAAAGNLRVEEDQIPAITELMENSRRDALPTKVLESAVLDLTDALPFTRSDCLLNHWLFLATQDLYKAVTVVASPKTGGRLPFTMRDAFIVFLYAHNRANGITLVEIPKLEAICVRKLQTPTRAQLRGLAEKRLVSDALIEKSLEVVESVGVYISTTAFYESMLRVHAGQLKHRWLYATQDHMHARAQVEQVVLHFYHNAPCELAPEGTLYADWFQERGLDIPTFSALESRLLSEELLRSCTGANLKDVKSLKEIQAAMLRLMAQLSSYSVQYLQTINSDPIRMVEWPGVRIGDDWVKGSDHTRVDVIEPRVQEVHARGRDHDFVPLDDVGPTYSLNSGVKHALRMDIGMGLQGVSRVRFRERMDLRPVGILKITDSVDSVTDDTIDRETEQYIPRGYQPITDALLGLNSPHYALDAADRQTLLDRWNAHIAIVGGPTNPLSNALPVSELPGFNYPSNLLVLQLATLELDGHDYPSTEAF